MALIPSASQPSASGQAPPAPRPVPSYVLRDAENHITGVVPHAPDYPGELFSTEKRTLGVRTSATHPSTAPSPGASMEWLLLEPERHRSVPAGAAVRTTASAEQMRPRGSIDSLAKAWRAAPAPVRELLEGMGLHTIFVGLTARSAASPTQSSYVLEMLAERWWDTTNTFHFPWGEMTVTPLDFRMITGLPFGGLEIRIDRTQSVSREALVGLLGDVGGRFDDSGYLSLSVLRKAAHATPIVPVGATLEQEALIYRRRARVLALLLIGDGLVADGSSRVHDWWVPFLSSLDRVRDFAWGRLGMASLYFYITAVSRRRSPGMGAFSYALEVHFLFFFIHLIQMFSLYLPSALIVTLFLRSGSTSTSTRALAGTSFSTPRPPASQFLSGTGLRTAMGGV